MTPCAATGYSFDVSPDRVDALPRAVIVVAAVLAWLSPRGPLGSQSPQIDVVVGRTVADIGYYHHGRLVSKSNGERVGATGGVSARWRSSRRLSYSADLGLVPRGQVSGSYWMNATYVDAAFSSDLALRPLSRVVRPYVGAGMSVGRLVGCRGGGATAAGAASGDCGREGSFTSIAAFDVSRELRFGVQMGFSPGGFAVELAHQRSMRSFEHPIRDARHRVWAVRLRSCVFRCARGV